jgi:hypothetical protein
LKLNHVEPARVLAASLLVMLALTAQPANAVVDVWLQPPSQQIAVAETCTLEVFVTSTGGDSLSCMECVVAFDATLLTLLTVEEGTLFENSGYPTFFDPQVVAPDTVSAVDCVLGYRSYFLPPGDLLRLVFRGEQEGVAAVRITSIAIWDIEHDPDKQVPLVLDPDAWITIGNPSGASTTSLPHARLTCYPNPFNPATTIELQLPTDGAHDVTVSVYSPSGRRVKSLFSGVIVGGIGRFEWDGRNDSGTRTASGVYFAVAETNDASYTTKLILIE